MGGDFGVLRSFACCKSSSWYATLYDHLGDIYAALRQFDKARDAWKKSLAVEPNETVGRKLDSTHAR